MIDLVINHTAMDSVLTEQHPDWYRREADGDLVVGWLRAGRRHDRRSGKTWRN